jgi:integrase
LERADILLITHGTGSLFHRIRKSTASYIRLNGGNATLQLGHSSMAITERYYDPRIVGVQDATKYMPKIDLPF